MISNTWQSIFAQSPAHAGYYDENELPHYNWRWPRGTWFQVRRDHLRERRPAWSIRKAQNRSLERAY